MYVLHDSEICKETTQRHIFLQKIKLYDIMINQAVTIVIVKGLRLSREPWGNILMQPTMIAVHN